MTDDKRANGADLPMGTVEARAVLFEEEGQYGPVFILQLADFLKALDTTRSAQTLSAMQVVCETVFHKHLGPKGTYSLHGSAFYIFRFGRLNAAEARRRARLAVDEIGHNLLSPHFIPFAEEELTKPSTEAPEAARAAARRPTENEWQVSSSSPSGETDDEQPSRTRQRRDVHAHARDTNDSGGGAAGDNATSRMKRAAQI